MKSIKTTAMITTLTRTIDWTSHHILFDNEDVQNSVTIYNADMQTSMPQVVLVPGWNAEAQDWMPFVNELKQVTKVHYFESREKESMQTQREAVDYSVEAMGRDLANYLNQLTEPYLLITASVNSLALIKAWPGLEVKPIKTVFISPVVDLRLPFSFQLFPYVKENWIKTLHSLAAKLIKPISSTTELNENRSVENVSHLKRYKASVEALVKTNIDPAEWKRINSRSMVVYAKKDRMHSPENGQKVIELIGAEAYYEVADFSNIKEESTANIIMEWFKAV